MRCQTWAQVQSLVLTTFTNTGRTMCLGPPQRQSGQSKGLELRPSYTGDLLQESGSGREQDVAKGKRKNKPIDVCDRVSYSKSMSAPTGRNPTRTQGVKDQTTFETETNYPWQFIK